ncbi:DUF3175 domain-containing protein [Dongia sedimenti]|uniref:DUF3175 domain-containing protein n=1 Tax=Dongia sedimenti TaxID=3064282 RepID=A0ABU0YKJ8_9PROT|nr:DUF3175 domain-containing protein [Rhodospirillaceae bacterium R-7]
MAASAKAKRIRRKPAHRKTARKATKRTTRKWSARVTERSDAMTLEDSVFKQRSAAAIARSLKHSAESSHRRKSPPFRSAMSMLNFYINRAGKNLSASRLRTLERAKDKLREAFGRPPKPAH